MAYTFDVLCVLLTLIASWVASSLNWRAPGRSGSGPDDGSMSQDAFLDMPFAGGRGSPLSTSMTVLMRSCR